MSTCVFVYVCYFVLCLYSVFCGVDIFSGLHSVTDSWMCGVIVGGGINLGSFVCGGFMWVCISYFVMVVLLFCVIFF